MPSPTSPSHRCSRLAAIAVAALLPVAAGAGVPVGLYPLQGEGLTDAERSEVQAIVQSALEAAERRGVLEPRAPLLLRGTCKTPITVGCVATLAKGGVVLYARAKRRGAALQVTALFVDATGRKTRPVAFPVDLFIQSLRPVNDALATLEAQLAAGELEDPTPPPPARPAVAGPPAPADRPAVSQVPLPPPPAARPAAPVAEPAIDLTPRPKVEPRTPPGVVERPAARDSKGRGWRRTAGAWGMGGGAAVLAAGVTVGVTGKRLGDALQGRYERGLLRPEDARLYRRVDQYEAIANALLMAGGALTIGGLTLFSVAPAGGAGVAVAGSF